MTDRQVRVIVSADVASAIRGLSQVEGGLNRVGQQGQQAQSRASSFGSALKRGLEVAGVTVGLAGLAGAIGKTISIGMSFQDSLNQLRAVSGASAAEMSKVSDTARALGNDLDLPTTSASDAAQAMLELSKGGLSVSESMAAAKGTLMLAAAAQIDGAQAAEIQSNALNAFGLSADQANHVADVLANTANAASGSITDFAAGMQQSATVAHAFGIGIEDSATVLGLFAKAGIQGSDAGTSFKTMLTALASPTKQQQEALNELNLTVYDAQGNFVGMKAITEQLAAAKGRLSQQDYNAAASTAFGADAVRAANILAEGGVAAWDNMSAAVGKAGGAQQLAGAMTQGLSGQLGKLQSSAEDVALSMFQNFAPALESVVGFATGVVGVIGDMAKWFAELPGPVQAAAIAFTAVTVLAGPLTSLSGAAITFGRNIIGAMTGSTAAITGAGSALSGFILRMRMAPTIMAAVGIAARGMMAALGGGLGIALAIGATALTMFATRSDDAADSTGDFTGAVDENTGALTENAQQVASKAAAESGASARYKALGGNVADYTAALAGNAEKQALVRTTLTNAANAAKEAGVQYQAAGVGADGMAIATDNVTTVVGEQGAAFTEANSLSGVFENSLAKVSQAQEEGKLTGEGMTGALGSLGGAAGDAAPKVSDMADALKAATENAQLMAGLTEGARQLSAVSAAASDASRALDLFKIAQDNADGRTRSLDEATANQADTLRALSAALKDGTAAATENKEAGDLNVQALNDWDVAALTATESGGKVFDEMQHMADQYGETTIAAYENAVATGNVAGAADVARAAATDSRTAFVNLMTQYNGGNTPAAELLADKLGILDGQKIDNKTFETINNDAVAQQKLRDAQAAEIQNKSFSVNAEDNATGILDGINRYQIANKSFVVTTINQTGTVNSSVPGGATGGRVGKLAGFSAGGKLPGLPPANPRVDNLVGYANGGAFGLRSKEWIIRQESAEKYGDKMMAAINAGTFQPSMAISASGGGAPAFDIVVNNLIDGQQFDGRTQVFINGLKQDIAIGFARSRVQS